MPPGIDGAQGSQVFVDPQRATEVHSLGLQVEKGQKGHQENREQWDQDGANQFHGRRHGKTLQRNI
ncbi:MAG: hypothetical protein ACK6DF_13775 [Betaproteobacteria bacterium]